MEITFQTVRGFFQPISYINKLSAQEDLSVKPLVGKVSILLSLSVLLSILYGMLGYRSEEIARVLGQHPDSYIEALQLLHATGIVFKSLVYPLFYFFLSTLAAYLFFKDISLKVLLFIHHYFIAFIVVHQAVHVILYYLFGIPTISSPFSLGIMVQILTDSPFLINLSSYFNLFYVTGMIFIMVLMKQQTSIRPLLAVLYIMGIHLFIALLGAGVSMINIDALLL
jgi:hypothetical protein